GIRRVRAGAGGRARHARGPRHRIVTGRVLGFSAMETLLGHGFQSRPPVDPASLSSVLAEVAGTAAETLQLPEVSERVALAIRRLIPLDAVVVVRILDEQWAVLHAATMPRKKILEASDCPLHECSPPTALADWSPRARPRQGPIVRVDDSLLDLDPSFPNDRRLIEKGVRSLMWEPFHRGAHFTGGVAVSSFSPHAFGPEHEEVLRPIAALLG